MVKYTIYYICWLLAYSALKTDTRLFDKARNYSMHNVEYRGFFIIFLIIRCKCPGYTMMCQSTNQK